MKKQFDSLGVLLLICAAVPLLFGAYALFHSIRFVSRAEKVVGTVIAIHVEKPWPGKRVGSFPVTEFVDARGDRHEVELRSYAFPVILEVGKTINLLFDPASPKEAIPDSWRARWAQPFIGIVFGTMLLGAAFFIGRTPLAAAKNGAVGD
jgi:hypothetical protein